MSQLIRESKLVEAKSSMQFSEVLAGLQCADIDYVLLGGLAVFLNGVSRVTMDIDLAIAMNDENLSKFIDFAVGLGLKPRIPVAIESLKSVDQIEKWFREKGMIAFSRGRNDNRRSVHRCSREASRTIRRTQEKRETCRVQRRPGDCRECGRLDSDEGKYRAKC